MSDEEYSDYDIDGLNDEQDINRVFTEEERNKLYFDENEDEENEKWVTNNYKSSGKKSDAYLSCPCCFTLLCVESQRHSTYKNQYRAINVNNCIVDKEQNIVYNDKRDNNIKNSARNKNSSGINNNKNRYSNNRRKLHQQQQQQQQQQNKQKKNQGIRNKLENTHLDEKEEKEETDTYENKDDTDSEEEDDGLDEEEKENLGIGSNNSGVSGESDSEDEDEVYQPVKCAVCDTHVAMFDKDEVYHFFNVFPS